MLPWRVEAVEGTGRSLCFLSFGDLSFALADSTFTPPPKRFTKPSQNCFMFFSLGLSSLVSSFWSRISDWFELVSRKCCFMLEEHYKLGRDGSNHFFPVTPKCTFLCRKCWNSHIPLNEVVNVKILQHLQTYLWYSFLVIFVNVVDTHQL